MNKLLIVKTPTDDTELKRTFGGALKGLYELDFSLYTQYVKVLIWLFEQEKEEELYIIECLTSLDMFDEYMAELPSGYEGTALWSKNIILCLVSNVMDNDLQRKLVRAYLDSLNH